MTKTRVNGEKKKTYDTYHRLVNMSVRELTELAHYVQRYRKHMTTRPIEKNIKLLDKPLSDWSMTDVSVANHIVYYISEMRKVPNELNTEGIPSNRDVCLMMWGHDPRKN